MTYYMRKGNSFNVTDEANVDLHTQLPTGNYMIKQDPFGNFYLEKINDFEAPSKIYGNTMRNTDRILRTFESRSNSTGVMLNGEKGSGKTLLGKMLAIEGAKRGIPCIVINAPWYGDAFNKLIQQIDQPCMVLFDEFEKVYDSQQQESILTLLDGVFPSKKLFVLTCNDKWRVDQHMRNRPGRIFYMMDFKGLDVDFIREYCKDNLTSMHYIEQLCQISALFSEFNFDMLKAIVEEMNRYGESPQEAMTMLNTKPEFSSKKTFDVRLVISGKTIAVENDKWAGNPLQGIVNIGYLDKTSKNEDDHEWMDIDFEVKHLAKVDADKGTFVFRKDNNELVLTKVPEKDFDYWRAF
jgi:hypothetical protein